MLLTEEAIAKSALPIKKRELSLMKKIRPLPASALHLACMIKCYCCRYKYRKAKFVKRSGVLYYVLSSMLSEVQFEESYAHSLILYLET